jgi:hypothetical protein
MASAKVALIAGETPAFKADYSQIEKVGLKLTQLIG